jgi:hypothetical protein
MPVAVADVNEAVPVTMKRHDGPKHPPDQPTLPVPHGHVSPADRPLLPHKRQLIRPLQASTAVGKGGRPQQPACYCHGPCSGDLGLQVCAGPIAACGAIPTRPAAQSVLLVWFDCVAGNCSCCLPCSVLVPSKLSKHTMHAVATNTGVSHVPGTCFCARCVPPSSNDNSAQKTVYI